MKSRMEMSGVGWAKRSVPNKDGAHDYKMLGTLRFAFMPFRVQPTQCPFRQSGLTLLEVMITVVILSLGLLGLAGLQLTGLKNNRDAYNSAVSAQVMQDMAERIRADLTGMRADSYDSLNISADASQCVAGVAVTLSNRAACQLTALPLGTARIREVSANSNSFYVAVLWRDQQMNGASGWTTDTTGNPATTACGTAVADTKCYYTMFRP
ncbi:MAG: type IV pilus modification protein PilV [Pseudomonadota bacterium]|nr:type IV pilus modification protein PilV [Pseudomonadota bacterium]